MEAKDEGTPVAAAVDPMERGNTGEWGDVASFYARGPTPGSVKWDETWFSCFCCCLFCPVSCFLSCIGTCFDPALRFFTGCVRLSVNCGRPICLAPAWWIYQPIGALRLILCSGKSRFNLFRSTRTAYGEGAWWWHGEGPWECPYAQVRATMENEQKRDTAFGAIHTATPELFPEKVLLFLDGKEHKAMRAVLMGTLTDPAAWTPRLGGLKEVLLPLAPKPCTLASMTKETTDKMVATSIWWLLFGVKLTEEEATLIASWGGSGAAGYFVFPRLIHRFLCNLLIKKVLKLRQATMEVFIKHGLKDIASSMNAKLGPHRRATDIELADEILFAVCFAGVGGTQHGTWGTLQFLQKQTIDIKQEYVNWPDGDMPTLYKQDEAAFIKECVRMDCPVTSAGRAFAEDTKVTFNKSGCFGCKGEFTHKKGTLTQYALSVANRDPAKFKDPNTFNPKRAEIDALLTWNGALDTPPENFPRICPGQKLSMAVIQTIVGMVQEVSKEA